MGWRLNKSSEAHHHTRGAEQERALVGSTSYRVRRFHNMDLPVSCHESDPITVVAIRIIKNQIYLTLRQVGITRNLESDMPDSRDGF